MNEGDYMREQLFSIVDADGELKTPATIPVPSMPPALKKLDMHLPETRPIGMNRAQRRQAIRLAAKKN